MRGLLRAAPQEKGLWNHMFFTCFVESHVFVQKPAARVPIKYVGEYQSKKKLDPFTSTFADGK